MMDEKERAWKDIEKLERMKKVMKAYKFDRKYPQVMEYVENYGNDANHFFEKGDYFTAFGAANYAYGFMEAVLLIEGRKNEVL